MNKYIVTLSLVFVLVFGITTENLFSAQFDASVPPGGDLYLKIHSNVHISSAKFSSLGTAISLTDISQISCIDTQFELYYGVKRSIMAGFLLPVDYILKSDIEKKSSSMFKMKNPWVIVQHQFLSKIICSASSIRIKLPITEIDPIEENLDIEDKQIDVYPVYYLDWQTPSGIYIYSQIGYKYRMKKGEFKPNDELKLSAEMGYSIVPGIIRIFIIPDYTRFFGSKDAGFLFNSAAGIRFFLGRILRVEVLTNADLFGKNRLRCVGGHLGVGYVF